MVKNESTESLHDFPIIPLVSFKSTCDRFMALDNFFILFIVLVRNQIGIHIDFYIEKVRFSKPKLIEVFQR